METAAVLLTISYIFACDKTLWLARLQPSHPFGMRAMDDDTYVNDVGRLGT